MGDKIEVMIADDHPVVREGIASFLKTVEDVIMAGEARDGREAVEMAQLLQPDVILMDLKMPRMNGVEATREILASQPGLQVIILTAGGFEDLVFAAIRAGAVGYLTKTANFEEVLHAIRQVYRGELALDPEITRRLLTSPLSNPPPPSSRALPDDRPATSEEMSRPPLTRRQVEILSCLGKGLNSQQIAGRIGVLDSTVRSHISHIFTNLGIDGRSDLLRALRQVRRGEPSLLPRGVVEQLKTQAKSTLPPPETLTQREIEVAIWLAKGLSNQQIGNRLYIAESTVRTHVSRLLKKLELTNRVEAALHALRQGWAALD